MPRFAPSVLRNYLFAGQIPNRECLRLRQTAQSLYSIRSHATRRNHTYTEQIRSTPDVTPFRKQLKDEAKRKKAEGTKGIRKIDPEVLKNWELTVGIEIHAQLNTARKLFSSAASTINDEPNSHVALFDMAMPGSMPIFQKETLIPAIRAALALNCDIQRISQFDRKHYFHWDQPAGYQITQYYEPFAKAGYITLYAHDGIAKEDGDSIQIGIKQVQMEQDTAKTDSRPGGIRLLDYNRVGLPLIEIITLPEIHHASTAAALVRKVQTLLSSVDACVLGMEHGGLRADVNVSVRRRDSTEEGNQYSGVTGLGQRTEIKNLSSFKSIEDAIIAECNRQILHLEAGGVITSETRGWTIGSTETKLLRSKEGEVDYRYMPDPDIHPIVIDDDLIEHLESTLGVLPDEVLGSLVHDYGLTTKDALSLIQLNDGGRAEYLRNVVDRFLHLRPERTLKEAGVFCGNWVLHEMGRLQDLNPDNQNHNPLQMDADGECIIPAKTMGNFLAFLDDGKITGKSAKLILPVIYEGFIKGKLTGKHKELRELIHKMNLWYRPLGVEAYEKLASQVMEENEHVVDEILAGKLGKVNFLLGMMMRNGPDGKVDAQIAREVLKKMLEGRKMS